MLRSGSGTLEPTSKCSGYKSDEVPVPGHQAMGPDTGQGAQGRDGQNAEEDTLPACVGPQQADQGPLDHPADVADAVNEAGHARPLATHPLADLKKN